jgi:hypothetical protein
MDDVDNSVLNYDEYLLEEEWKDTLAAMKCAIPDLNDITISNNDFDRCELGEVAEPAE